MLLVVVVVVAAVVVKVEVMVVQHKQLKQTFICMTISNYSIAKG